MVVPVRIDLLVRIEIMLMTAPAFRIGKGVFTLRLWPTIITFVMLAGLIGLGTWQVQRLHWKQDLIQQIAKRMQQPPIDAFTVTDPQNSEYRPIFASGSFVVGQEFYMHAISLRGEDGYHILAPMKLNSGAFLLVDRGWVPVSLRDPGMRNAGINYGATQVTGLLRLEHHRWMQPKDYPLGNDWYGYKLKEMAAQNGLPDFLPFVLEADATPNDGGYPVGGQTRVDIPNNHLMYAFIWYSLALALLVIYFKQGWKPLPTDEDQV